jgi:sodium/hydrogen antiporter
LTVARMLPVTVSMVGTDVSLRDRLFLGWVGPRAIATLVFGLLAFIHLPAPDSDFVRAVTVVTVVASIVVHGLSTGVVAARYGRNEHVTAGST